MKLLKYILLLLIVVSCSSDGDSSKDGTGGSLAVFVLKGNYLYTVDNYKLNVFSLSDIGHPALVNQVSISWNIETLFSYGDYLFIGSRNGMFIYSLADPENPVQMSEAQHFTSCDPVVANATHSFVTLHSGTTCGNDLNQLLIYNTTNPQAPELIHQKDLVHPMGLGLYGHYLIVCDDKIKIFDIINPAEPVIVKTIDNSCFDVIIKGDDLYAIGENGLYRYLLDENDIQNVTFKSTIAF